MIASRDDVLVPDLASEGLAAALPGATLVRLDGGHACNVTAPRDYERLCLAFLKEGEGLCPSASASLRDACSFPRAQEGRHHSAWCVLTQVLCIVAATLLCAGVI